MDGEKVRVIFKIGNVDAVSGSGYVAKILFEVVGDIGDTSAIDIPADRSDDPDDRKRMLNSVEVDYDDKKHKTWVNEIPANWFGDNVTIGTAPSMPVETPTPTPMIVAASAPTPTATSIQTSAPNPDSPAFTAGAQDAPSAAVPAAPSEKDGLQDILTTHNFISIYSIIGLLAFIYSLTLFR